MIITFSFPSSVMEKYSFRLLPFLRYYHKHFTKTSKIFFFFVKLKKFFLNANFI